MVSLVALLVACGGGSDGNTDPQDSSGTDSNIADLSANPKPAPDFALTDRNPSSPTYNQQRKLSETKGRVVLIYFVSFT